METRGASFSGYSSDLSHYVKKLAKVVIDAGYASYIERGVPDGVKTLLYTTTADVLTPFVITFAEETEDTRIHIRRLRNAETTVYKVVSTSGGYDGPILSITTNYKEYSIPPFDMEDALFIAYNRNLLSKILDQAPVEFPAGARFLAKILDQRAEQLLNRYSEIARLAHEEASYDPYRISFSIDLHTPDIKTLSVFVSEPSPRRYKCRIKLILNATPPIGITSSANLDRALDILGLNINRRELREILAETTRNLQLSLVVLLTGQDIYGV